MSDEQRLLELIHADLDGRLDRAEKAELAKRLLADPAARRLQDQLRQTETLLEDIPKLDPPEGLRPAILEAVGLSDHNRGGRREADGGVGLRLAAAVVAGLVVVGLGYGLLSEEQDTAALQGSIAVASRPAVSLKAGGGEVLADLTPAQDGARLRLEARGVAAGNMVVEHDPAMVTCRRAGNSVGLSSPASGRWVLDLASGDGVVELDCSGAGMLHLETWSGEVFVDRAKLELRR